MKTPIVAFLLVTSGLFAQSSDSEIVNQGLKLNERYQQMKSKSQTYGDYKVIKETVLEGFWKTTMDSVNKSKSLLQQARESGKVLEMQLEHSLLELKQKEKSIEEITYAGTHINVFGLDFHKAVFVSFVTLVILGLLVALGVITGRLKMIYHAMRDKIETVDILSQEFETYKRKALEKQMKLSRELQDERNKIYDLHRA